MSALVALALAAQLDLHDAWTASASDQVRATVQTEVIAGRPAQCLRYDFGKVAGYAVMRHAWPAGWPATWPEDFIFTSTLLGEGAPNSLQIKFVDASGQNVWWVNKPGFAPSAQPQDLLIKRRQIGFAWGPDIDHQLRSTRSIEFVVATTGARAQGGSGRLCLTGLGLTPIPPTAGAPPIPRIEGHGARLTVDLGRERDFNGLLLRWARAPTSLRVSASLDGRQWRTLARQPTGPLTALWLPEHSARWLRLEGDAAMALAALTLPSPESGGDADWPDRNAMLAAVAHELPRGTLPRAFIGEQNYWTLVGVEGGGAYSALISEDGAVEIGRGGPSIEPQIRMADAPTRRWLNWANAAIGQSLAQGSLPVPSVHLAWPGLQLDVTAAAEGPATAPRLLVRYVLRNTGRAARALDFGLALRPWQVNPPQQFLNTPGGARLMRQLDWSDGTLSVDGQPFAHPLFVPDGVTAQPFSGGLGLDALAAAPALARLADDSGLPSALLRRHLTLAPGERVELGSVFALAPAADLTAPTDLDASIAAVEARWLDRFGDLDVQLPPGETVLARTLHTALAQILMSRDGPALRPGTRAYARTWIRDGAMMVEALVRMGRTDVARDFVDWFAPQIFASGKVPCCIDDHGADPVVENDADGEFLYAVAEVWRATRDRAWLASHWPQVQAVVAHLDTLREQSRADPATPPHARGLLPPSISHEGYSDQPAWSFWDDFWALRGYKDAVQIAEALGETEAERRYAAARDAFASDLAAAVRATADHFGLDTLSGAADRGDVDPTSSTMALDPSQAADLLPQALLANTFTRYAADATGRADGTRPEGEYTPYELRTVGALVRLGDADAAQALLDFFFADQRPQAWHQWAEVVDREARRPRFIGDMPHAWVASDFLRSALDLFAFERDADHSIVLGAGITARWRQSGDVGIRGLETSCGRLDWKLLRRGAAWQALIEHRPERLAACGRQLVLRWPGRDALPRARTAGRELAWIGRELVLPPDATSIDLESNGAP